MVVDEDAREVTTDELMALAPGVLYSMLALAPSEMLLTVHRVPIDDKHGQRRPAEGRGSAGWLRAARCGCDGCPVSFIRVDYDVELAAREVVRVGLPVEFAEFLRTGEAPAKIEQR